MAGKARRAAARQSELSRRRKKGQRGPTGIPAAPRPSEQQAPSGGGAALAMEGAGVVSTAPAVTQREESREPVATPAVQATSRNRGQGRFRGERPAAYNYVGAEMRRIAALTTVVLAAVVALSFVL